MMGVPRRVIARHDDTFLNVLGLVRGRLYYNLLNWYRILALLPGLPDEPPVSRADDGCRAGAP